MTDLLVRGALTVAGAEEPEQLDVAIEDGRIAALGPELAGPARAELDGHGLHLFAGVVDPHVHLNDPGRAHWEGVPTGTAALVAGGATTAVDMPLNSIPPTTDGPGFEAKLAAAAGRAHCDFGLWGGCVPGNADELAGLAARGVVGFKAFMSATGVPEFAACDDDDLHAGMAAAAGLGLPVAVHAEDDELTGRLAARAAAEGRVSMRDYLASRPLEAEVRAVERALTLAEATGCALHVVHISSGHAAGLVAEARARGVDVTCEVCPHHLLLTDEDAERIGLLAKCAPPLRPAAETERLWAGLAAGDIAWVASDHSPAAPELRTGDALQAWGGIAGAQSTLELMLTAGRIPLPRLASVLGGAAARRLRLAGKGKLEVGADADLALVDLRGVRTLAPGELWYRHKVSPYCGRTLRARVERTLLRGETVYAAGAVVGPARGRFVAPVATRSRV
jgi:allantoinase